MSHLTRKSFDADDAGPPARPARGRPVAPRRRQHDDAAARRLRRRSHQDRAAGRRHPAQLPRRGLRHLVEDLCAQQAERLPRPAPDGQHRDRQAARRHGRRARRELSPRRARSDGPRPRRAARRSIPSS